MGSSGITALLTALGNFVFLVAVALGLSREDLKTIVEFALLYSFLGLCLSATVPSFLLKRGVVCLDEAQKFKEMLLLSWVVSIFFLLPKIKTALES